MLCSRSSENALHGKSSPITQNTEEVGGEQYIYFPTTRAWLCTESS